MWLVFSACATVYTGRLSLPPQKVLCDLHVVRRRVGLISSHWYPMPAQLKRLSSTLIEFEDPFLLVPVVEEAATYIFSDY